MNAKAGLALADAAASMVGTPFRLHGRDPNIGLDCIGLVLVALSMVGRPARAVSGYGLRNLDLARFTPLFAHCGFERCTGPIAPGDLLQVQPGPAQMHLLIANSSGGFIHAHAGLRRVVETPGPLAWSTTAHWRLQSN